MSYKLYKVTFDSNPGGWKSGSDPYKLIIAESKEDAIEIAKKPTWCEGLKRENDIWVTNYYFDKDNTSFDYTREGISISVKEIRFDGFEMKIDTHRNHRLSDLLD